MEVLYAIKENSDERNKEHVLSLQIFKTKGL